MAEADDATDQSRLNLFENALRRLSDRQIAELGDMILAETNRRLKIRAEKKNPSEMADAEFEAWKRRLIDKAKENRDDN